MVSIVAGSLAGLTWQVLGEPFGLMAIVAGTVAGCVALVVASLSEGTPAAPV